MSGNYTREQERSDERTGEGYAQRCLLYGDLWEVTLALSNLSHF